MTSPGAPTAGPRTTPAPSSRRAAATYGVLFAALLVLAATADAAAEPPPELPVGPRFLYGWVLLEDEPEAVARSLARAVQEGVTHVQLSHQLVRRIDDVANPRARARLLDAIARADAAGIETFAWSHELSRPRASGRFCWAPGSGDLRARADAYRRVSTRCRASTAWC